MLPGHVSEGVDKDRMPGDPDNSEGGGSLLDWRLDRRQENLNGVPEDDGHEPPQVV